MDPSEGAELFVSQQMLIHPDSGKNKPVASRFTKMFRVTTVRHSCRPLANALSLLSYRDSQSHSTLPSQACQLPLVLIGFALTIVVAGFNVHGNFLEKTRVPSNLSHKDKGLIKLW